MVQDPLAGSGYPSPHLCSRPSKRTMNEPATTVFCAVWSEDPNRHALVRGHLENLLAQTRPVEIVYVFDSGDRPPEGLSAQTVVVNSPIGIYEAWNVALSLCRTEFVMNLNLDDRLAPDAIELLEREMSASGANLIGGDWKICFTQDETDAVAAVAPASTAPFRPEWPPTHGVPARLGSGTGERGTFGPATIWRLDCHRVIPRYPYRTTDNTPIRSISDALWWRMLQRIDPQSLRRLPFIIGNYHSHPGDQAEFRLGDESALLGSSISVI